MQENALRENTYKRRESSSISQRDKLNCSVAQHTVLQKTLELGNTLKNNPE
jgi:hypothetical protein